ncbi:SRPBCC family protein [Dehalogenimonas etheniformans]|uniref:Cyclase n=1 Tax=Dehalogenimonas etheniformans TaxID=1536648 RepID=A0A2P5P702_9CHLR|nr:SRPBCC family protein [Dehalogenimonas etheniformans]PPD58049.1 cyclase [Dehalogenimonas etheniformans]QNT75399.1 SRPBCC family protein [Dehalogenimonas etheniformans]
MDNLKYHFVTKWHFDAPPDRVWSLIRDGETMPQWWPGVKRFEIIGHDKSLKIGQRINAAVQGLVGELAFTLEITEIENGKRLKMKVTGDLEGEGIWTLEEEGDGCRTIYQWDVSTSGWLMNALGIVFKPVLMWNHNRVMVKGYEAIKTKLILN